MKIWKYYLDKIFMAGHQGVKMPVGAQILKVDLRDDPASGTLWPTMWVMARSTITEEETRVFYLFLTGQEFDATNLKYIGTTVHNDHNAWHIFEDVTGR